MFVNTKGHTLVELLICVALGLIMLTQLQGLLWSETKLLNQIRSNLLFKTDRATVEALFKQELRLPVEALHIYPDLKNRLNHNNILVIKRLNKAGEKQMVNYFVAPSEFPSQKTKQVNALYRQESNLGPKQEVLRHINQLNCQMNQSNLMHCAVEQSNLKGHKQRIYVWYQIKKSQFHA